MKRKAILFTSTLLLLQCFMFAWNGDHMMTAYANGNSNETEVIYHTSFEDSTDSIWLKTYTNYDTSDYKTGTQSLKYNIPSNNSGPGFRFDVIPGASYDVTVWAKTTGLVVANDTGRAGARVALDGFTADETWKLGSYMHAVDTQGEWRQLKLPTYIPDEETTMVEVALYSEGQSGVIWFDDLVITETKPQIVSSRLVTPAYRGIIHPDSDEPIQIYMEKADGVIETDYTTTVQLLGDSDQVIAEQQFDGQLSLRASFLTSGLSAGAYQVVASVVSNLSEEEVYRKSWAINKAASITELPASYVDDQGRFWRDGELFFPIGIYTANTTAEDLFDLKNSAINTILPYDYPDLAKLNLAHSYGMNVIFSFKDFFYGFPFAPSTIQSVEDEAIQIAASVNQYKNHPALLAWYLSDETIADSRLATHYQTIVENDADHPAYIVDFQLQDYFTIGETSDVFGLDIYPVHGRATDNIKLVGELQKEVIDELASKGQWAIVQAHNLNNYPSDLDPLRGPTRDEMRNMAWQYITEGARGIIFYSLFDLRQDVSGKTYNELFANVSTVAKELENMVPVIFSEEAVPEIGGLSQPWLHTMVRSYNNNLYVIAVNNSNAVQQATFTLEGYDTEPIHVWNEQRSINWGTEQFSDTFAPYSVHIYEIGSGEAIAEPLIPQWGASDQLTITNIAQTSVTLNWPAAQDAATSYRIYKNGVLYDEVDQLSLSYTVNGLTANTSYEFHVTAINHLNNEGNGLVRSATTKQAVSNSVFPSIVPVANEPEPLPLETSEIEFNDIDKHWALSQIKEAAQLGIIAGYSDGTFKPDKPITRAEFIVILMRLMNSYLEETDLTFTDVDQIGSWARKEVARAVQAGIVQGYKNNQFLPNRNITRAEMAVMLFRALKLTTDGEKTTIFADAELIPKWAEKEINSLHDHGIVQGRNNNQFDPFEQLTRAEAVTVMLRIAKI